jgi:hypothetical protein
MARCPVCGGVTPTGPLCEVVDTDHFTWTGDGTEATPFALSAVLDVDVDQLLECTEDGLDAVLPDLIANPPYCKLHRSTNLSVPNNTLTAIPFNIETVDTDTMFSSANPTRITFTTEGDYTVVLNCTWDNNDDGDRMAWIRKNGTDYLAHDSRRHGGGDLFLGHSLSCDDFFDAGDYVEAMVQHTRGTALLIVTEDYSPHFSASYT